MSAEISHPDAQAICQSPPDGTFELASHHWTLLFSVTGLEPHCLPAQRHHGGLAF